MTLLLWQSITAWFETLPEEYQTILFEEADKAREVDLQEMMSQNTWNY